MTSKIIPSQRGKGRVEYLGLRKEIEQNLLTGHTRRAIHTYLIKEDKMTLSYQRFCYYVNFYSSHCLQRSQQEALTPSQGSPAIRTVSSSTLLPENNGGGSYKKQQENEPAFSFNKKVTKEDLDKELV